MKISIFGLGYVGSVSAACWAEIGYTVIGVDINEEKVKLINSGKSPVVEPKLDNLISRVVADNKLSAVTDYRGAIKKTDLTFVCVNTPNKKDGEISLDTIKATCTQIGDALKYKDSYHTIAIRSTILPGTINLLTNIIEEASIKKVDQDFKVLFNPEFMREGTAIEDFYNPPFTIVGTDDEILSESINEIYSHINAPLYLLKIKEAEMLKYACNAFHAAKIVFANEIGIICKELEIDSHRIMDIFTKDTNLNISPLYLIPGFAFGGSCLPKDLKALLHQANSLDIRTPLLESILESNDLLIKRFIDRVLSFNKKKIGVLGLSFKEGTDDLRASPILSVVKSLYEKKLDLTIYDTNIDFENLSNPNKKILQEHIPDFSNILKNKIEDVIRECEILIISKSDKEYLDAVEFLSPSQIVLDLVRLIENKDIISGHYEGISWV